MKKFLLVLLHLIGFPLLIGVVVWKSMPIIQAGMSYGIFVFGGIILTCVFALIYYLAYIILAKGKKSIYRQTLTLSLIAVIMLGAFWGVLDIAAPDLLSDATSGTIFYEDLTDDYEARVEVNKELLDVYIQRNVANGTLSALTEEEYLEQGYANEEVQELLTQHFKSIDAGGYKTFDAPWIDLANSDRLTMGVLVHLILDERVLEQEYPFPMYNEQEQKILEDPVNWSVLDMMGKPMDFEIAFIKDLGIIAIGAQGVVNNFLKSVSGALEDEVLLGSPIFIKLDAAAGKISLIPSNEIRGVLDYQSMAWLDSNGLIYLLCSVLGMRKYFLIFAGVILVTTYLIGLLRASLEKEDKKEIGLDSRASMFADPQFKVERNRVALFNAQQESYFALSDPNAQYDYAAMQLKLMQDRERGVARKYTAEELR